MGANGHRTPQVRMVAVGGLIPYPNNARTHTAAQVGEIAASIKHFGWTVPILIDENGGVLAGHGRLEAAKAMGMEKVPAIVAAGMTEEQKRAYVLADNKLAENAGWDDALLRAELSDLRTLGADLQVIGFGPDELAAIFGEAKMSPEVARAKLSEKFIVPPFSVLDARQGYWQDRKAIWLALGIKSEVGRGAQSNTSLEAPPGERPKYNQIRSRQRPAAAPGGSARPACDYSKRQRGDGAGRPIGARANS